MISDKIQFINERLLSTIHVKEMKYRPGYLVLPHRALLTSESHFFCLDFIASHTDMASLRTPTRQTKEKLTNTL